MRPATVLAASFLVFLAGCTTVPAYAPPARQPQAAPVVHTPSGQPIPPTLPVPALVTGFRAPQVLQAPGLEGVIRRDAASLVRLFGDPRLDVREGDMRKLQFAGQACVLDLFLYPLTPKAEPVATHVEARRASDGQEVDRAACVAALKR